MISTIMAVQDAGSKSMTDPDVLLAARDLIIEACGDNRENFDRMTTLLFEYSATLASTVTVNTLSAVLSVEDMYELQKEMSNFDSLARSILSEELPDENA